MEGLCTGSVSPSGGFYLLGTGTYPHVCLLGTHQETQDGKSLFTIHLQCHGSWALGWAEFHSRTGLIGQEFYGCLEEPADEHWWSPHGFLQDGDQLGSRARSHWSLTPTRAQVELRLQAWPSQESSWQTLISCRHQHRGLPGKTRRICMWHKDLHVGITGT